MTTIKSEQGPAAAPQSANSPAAGKPNAADPVVRGPARSEQGPAAATQSASSPTGKPNAADPVVRGPARSEQGPSAALQSANSPAAGKPNAADPVVRGPARSEQEPAAAPLSRRPSVLLVEELPLNREAFASLIRSWPDFAFAGAASTAREALELTAREHPDVVLLDFHFADLFSLELVRQLRAAQPDLRCVVLAQRSDAKTAADVIRAGAHGLAVKSCSSDDLRSTLLQVLGNSLSVPPDLEVATAMRAAVRQAGDPVDDLSAREHQVYMMLTEGVKPKEIAVRMQVSPKTVDSYRANIMRKLNVRDFASLMRIAVERERVLTGKGVDPHPPRTMTAAAGGGGASGS